MKIMKKIIYSILFSQLAIASLEKMYAGDFQKIGDVLAIAVPGYALTLAMREDGYEGVKQFALSCVLSQSTSELLKRAVPEKRPDYVDGNPKNSFPSGHAAGAFTGAFFIHRRYGFQEAIIPYGLAVATAWSRVHAKRHHVHDVIAGALISGLWNWIFVDEEKKENPLTLSPEGSGAKLTYTVDF
jgi:membrane-associated phospholipid phosphatase